MLLQLLSPLFSLKPQSQRYRDIEDHIYPGFQNLFNDLSGRNPAVADQTYISTNLAQQRSGSRILKNDHALVQATLHRVLAFQHLHLPLLEGFFSLLELAFLHHSSGLQLVHDRILTFHHLRSAARD
jgi:hypothetical protein